MTSFVLVHGGAHGAWCWERLVPLLEAGPGVERVVALDLVGHGTRVDERSDFNEITIDDYVDDVVGALETMDLHGVVIVGHSLAGCSIPQAAARIPERVKRLVLLSALVPRDGMTVAETRAEEARAAPAPADFRRMFCTDMDEATAERHLSRVYREPREAMHARVRRPPLPESVALTYVYLLRDEALPLERQRRYAATLAITDTPAIDTGHSAMVTRPEELADILLRYA